MVCDKNWFLGDNEMSGDIEKEKTKAELENLGRLVDRYAQSRSLELLMWMVLFAVNVILILLWVKLLFWKKGWLWPLSITILVWGWFFLSGWLLSKAFKRYACFLYKEGQIELEEKKIHIPLWACAAYIITFWGPAFLNMFDVLPVRWALVTSFTSIGIFMLYIGKKQNAKLLTGVFAGLILTAAAATAIGLPTPFMDRDWLYSIFLSLMIYFVGAGVLAAVVVHIYNRKVLRKIKEMRLFCEQQ
jgi:hypothetical protein